MVAAAAGADGGLFERAQARRRLARIPDPGRVVTARIEERVDERPHAGRDSRKVTEEVERRALGGEDRRQWAPHDADGGARRDERALTHRPLDVDALVDLAEGLGGACRTREDATGAHHELGLGVRVGRHQRRREIADRREIFGQSPSDRIAHCVQWRMKVRIGAAHRQLRPRLSCLSAVSMDSADATTRLRSGSCNDGLIWTT